MHLNDSINRNHFNTYFDNCYRARSKKNPNIIYMLYDINYIRMLKFAKLEGKEIIKNNISGVCLFILNYDNGYILCDYNKIWLYYENKCDYWQKQHNCYTPPYSLIVDFISDMLQEKNIYLDPTYIHGELYYDDLIVIQK